MKPWLKSTLCQLRTSSAVMALAFCEGLAIGWPSPALEKLADAEKSPFVVSAEERSWIVSFADLGIMVGAWTSALVFARAGRRHTVSVGPAALLLWVLLTFFATSPAFLMAARLLCGMSQGIAISFCYIYVGEVASARMRGVLILAMAILIPLGQLVAFMYGPYVSFRWQAIAPLPVVVLIFVCIVLWMEESPFHLAAKGRDGEVLEVLRRLRRGSDPREVELEAAEICRAVSRQRQEAAGTWMQTFAPPGTKHGCLLALVISGSLAVVGIPSVLSYTTQIFDASGAPIEKNVSSILVMAIKTGMVLVAMLMIENLGRRVQLTVASLGNAVAMGGMCAFMIVKDIYLIDTTGVTWIPFVLMILYISCTGVGVNTVPQVLMSELLSQHVKVILAPIIMTVVSITSFLSNRFFIQLGESNGYHILFGVFASANLFIAIFTILLVPETKGKTLVEVNEILRRNALVGKKEAL